MTSTRPLTKAERDHFYGEGAALQAKARNEAVKAWGSPEYKAASKAYADFIAAHGYVVTHRAVLKKVSS